MYEYIGVRMSVCMCVVTLMYIVREYMSTLQGSGAMLLTFLNRRGDRVRTTRLLLYEAGRN